MSGYWHPHWTPHYVPVPHHVPQMPLDPLLHPAVTMAASSMHRELITAYYDEWYTFPERMLFKSVLQAHPERMTQTLRLAMMGLGSLHKQRDLWLRSLPNSYSNRQTQLNAFLTIQRTIEAYTGLQLTMVAYDEDFDNADIRLLRGWRIDAHAENVDPEELLDRSTTLYAPCLLLGQSAGANPFNPSDRRRLHGNGAPFLFLNHSPEMTWYDVLTPSFLYDPSWVSGADVFGSLRVYRLRATARVRARPRSRSRHRRRSSQSHPQRQQRPQEYYQQYYEETFDQEEQQMPEWVINGAPPPVPSPPSPEERRPHRAGTWHNHEQPPEPEERLPRRSTYDHPQGRGRQGHHQRRRSQWDDD